ncbi:pyrroline-5-carboxylate reductase family protein [Novosphingobium arvoryzae]|uniref:Pyrroline-5-carboxylate reductase n=1 Tax=Novosphingobium arvoryzae TaxID=1256514 RepID=A0A918VD69_9SPHN|nr:pyrroline-5-carboxylate reductase dimerization domain-containing protein [Novosphingobium arvoryzae]GGZ92347.1 pyrroline-5-carboxylate reductase [Novosphingobium arvoryzae]
MRLDSILLLGCGNMGGAMLAGWLAGGADPARFTVVDPYLAEAPAGVELLRALPQRHFDAILLGVKPQMLDDVAPALTALAGADTVVLSILAGVELASLSARFPAARAIVRLMPNLAAAIGKSPVALFDTGLDDAGRAAVTTLMDPLGAPEWLAAESEFDLVTALAGSGPGFVYRFIDALAAGASALGLDPAQAQRLAVATVEGAALLAAASPHSPAELARRVASPGGSTQKGLDVLDEGGALLALVQDTLRAARDRNAEMAAAARAAS